MAESTPPHLPSPHDDSPRPSAPSGPLSKRRPPNEMRRVLRHGAVQVDFIRYRSPDLDAFPGEAVTVRVDPDDAGYVFVWHGRRWHRCNAEGGPFLDGWPRHRLRSIVSSLRSARVRHLSPR